RARPRAQRADWRARLRACGAFGRPARNHAGESRRGDPVRARTQAVRTADRRVPADAGDSRRHVHDTVRLPRICLRRRSGFRPRTTPPEGRRGRALFCASEKAPWVAGEAIRCLGGNGYINEFATGRLWRDAKLYEIGAGTSEIPRWLIGGEAFGEAAGHDR